MDAIKGLKALLSLGLTVFSLNPSNAAEVISLDPSEEISLSVRLENFVKNPSPIIGEYVAVPVDRLNELKKKFLTRDLGPLEFKLTLVNPTQLRSNALGFNLDLIESYNILRDTDGARQQLINDVRIMRDDGLSLLRAPFEGAADAVGMIRSQIVL